MFILFTINLIINAFLGVVLFNLIKEREDEIEELYNLIYEEKEYKKNINKKSRVIHFDSNVF